MLTSGNTVFDRLFPICAIEDASIESLTHVHEVIANMLVWSTDACLEGKWPTRCMRDEEFDVKSWRGKRQGKDLADGWKIAIIPRLAPPPPG